MVSTGKHSIINQGQDWLIELKPKMTVSSKSKFQKPIQGHAHLLVANEYTFHLSMPK